MYSKRIVVKMSIIAYIFGKKSFLVILPVFIWTSTQVNVTKMKAKSLYFKLVGNFGVNENAQDTQFLEIR